MTTHYLIFANHTAHGLTATDEADAMRQAREMGVADAVVRVDRALTQEEWDAGSKEYAYVDFNGQSFSIFDRDFTRERAEYLAGLSAEYAEQGKLRIAAGFKAKSDYITATLDYLAAPHANPAPMTLEQFRATGRTVTVEEAPVFLGMDVEDLLVGATGVRIYAGNHWIMQNGPRVTGTDEHNWYLILGLDEYDTFRGGETLADLEQYLFDWTGYGDASEAAA